MRIRREPVPVSTVPDQPSLSHLRRTRVGRRLGVSAFALFLGLGLSSRLGPLERSIAASEQGYSLSVSFPAVTRPGLAASWSLEVEHSGGWSEPVVLAVTRDYFDIFDIDTMIPSPSATRVDGDRVILEFDPPEGDSLTVQLDGRVEPGIQASPEATTAIQTAVGAVAEVRYRTWLVP